MAGSKKLEINDLEKLNGGDFKKLREALQSDFEGRVSEKAEYEDGSKYKYWEFGQKHWYIQIKTIWDDCVNHYEVIYEARTDPKNIKFIEDGVRVELHIEQWDDKMDDEEKKKMNKKALSLDKFLKDKDPYLEMENVNRDKKYEWHHNTHRWILKKNIEREGANKYDFYDIIKDELNRAIKILDPLISQFLLKDKCDELAELLKSNHNLILTGAPGTGKTFLAKQIASEIILGKMKEDEVKKSNIADYREFVQFHPSYDYTDFVEGLRPCIQKQNNKKANTSQDTVVESSPDPQTKSGNNGNIGFELRPGVFKEFCDNAKAQKDKSYVFIIDEINRGDISKIFGELFFSIDPEYRGEKGAVETQYSNMHDEPKEKFYVPENVYIIGTMNDIDRSVESMDFAMRRRFTWQEIKAKDTQHMLDDLSNDEKMKGKNKMDPADIQLAKNRMDNLNDKISDEKEIGLNSAYHIGASYFMKLANYFGSYSERCDNLWKNHLEGVLREYLRGDDKIEEKMGKLKDAYDK